MKRKCRYCHKWYDGDSKHECHESISQKKVNNRLKQRQYYAENKDDPAYKAIHSKQWRDFRKMIIIADGGFCQRCFIKYHRMTLDNLEVHHIIPRTTNPEMAYDENNVITVCKTCNLELGLNGIDFDWDPNKRKINHDITL